VRTVFGMVIVYWIGNMNLASIALSF